MTRPPDRAARNRAALAELFPACVTAVRDPDGTPRTAIGLELLRTACGEHLVEGPHERLHLDWPGERDALLTVNRPADRALRPGRAASEVLRRHPQPVPRRRQPGRPPGTRTGRSN